MLKPLWLDNPHWLNCANTPPLPSIDGDYTSDVCIIGGGISGALCAHALNKANIQTILVDKDRVGFGSSLASTLLLQYEIDTDLYKLSKKYTEEQARTCYKLCIDAINDIEQICSERDINDFYRLESLYVPGGRLQVCGIKKEYDARKRAGIDVYFLSQNAIHANYGLDEPCAILSKDAAIINPYRFITTTLKQCEKQTLKVFENSEVTNITTSKDDVTVYFKQHKINCKHLILCMGYNAFSVIENKHLATFNYSFVFSYKEKSHLPETLYSTLIWEAKRPYIYTRPNGDLLLMGGADVPANQPLTPQLVKKQTDKLFKKLKKTFPRVDETSIVNRWGGLFAETPDGLPYIGKHNDYPNCFFVLGYGGNGALYSQIGAKMLVEQLNNKRTYDHGLFGFNR